MNTVYVSLTPNGSTVLSFESGANSLLSNYNIAVDRLRNMGYVNANINNIYLTVI